MRPIQHVKNLTLSIACLSFTPVGAAQLPEVVEAHIAELRSYCTDVGGNFQDPFQAILIADFNQDKRPDYVVDQLAISCDGAASLYSGSGGAQVNTFVSTPKGYINAWSGGAYGAEVEQGVLWLSVGGTYCGQKHVASRADAIYCKRALTWHSAKRKMIIDPRIKPRPITSN